MLSDKGTQKRNSQMVISIHLYRSRRRKQASENSPELRDGKELDQLIRQKIVRELHDGLSQTVSALAMRINFARRLMISDPVAAQAELEKVEDLVRDTTREIRHMIFIFRTAQLDSLELTLGLHELVEKMRELFNLEIELFIRDGLVNQLPLIDQKIIYSIVEEAIDSARKRNDPGRLVVRLDRLERDVILLEIENQGDISAQAEQLFQGQELESIQKFGQLISGSVNVERDGKRMQVLFPFSETAGKGTLPSL